MRYTITDREAGNPIEDASTLEDAIAIVRGFAQEDVDDGNEASLDAAMEFYAVYDNIAQETAWTHKTGILPR